MFGKDKQQGPDLGKVQEAVNSARGAGVDELSVRQNGTVIEIHGKADNLSEKQRAFKTITDRIGDAAGVVNLIAIAAEPTPGGKLNTNILGRGGPASPATGGRTHTVKKGETLSHIAQEYYGKASEYNRIFEANHDQLNDPDKIREGMKLQIP